MGGGYIGLEVAASAIKKGVNVTVLEAAERLMQRVTGPEMSTFFYAKHTAAGVDVRLGTAVTGFEAGDKGRVAGVTLADGGNVPADIVLVSIGVIPETTLAENAGLLCDDGIVVDEFSRRDMDSLVQLSIVGFCEKPDVLTQVLSTHTDEAFLYQIAIELSLIHI